MTEYHPPMTGVQSHFEEEIAALAQKYYEEEGRPRGRELDHWLRAEQELRQHSESEPAPETEADHVVEESMHLGR